MSSRPVGYLQLLRQNSSFRRLWIGQLVSSLGDWFNTVAVLALVFELTGSGFATGLIIIASTLPAFLLTPFAGIVADRFDRRRVMIAADVTRAALALGMLLVRSPDQIWLLYVFTALLVVFSSFFAPALSASVPNLVERAELLSANGLSSSTRGLMLAVGAAVGGAAIAALGRDAAFVVNSLSFLFSASMIFSIRKPFKDKALEHSRATTDAWQQFRASLGFASTHPQVSAAILVKTGWGLAAGVILLLTIFAQSVFHTGAAGIGWLYSARGLGALLGPYAAQRFVGFDLAKMRRMIFFSFLVAGLGYLAFGTAPAFWVAAVAVMIAHIGGGTLWALSSTILQLLTPDRLQGRIFAIDFGLSTVTTALSTFMVGAAVEHWDARVVAEGTSVIFIVYALLWGAAILVSHRRNAIAWQDRAPAPLDPRAE